MDELLSFPAAGHALIASTKRYPRARRLQRDAGERAPEYCDPAPVGQGQDGAPKPRPRREGAAGLVQALRRRRHGMSRRSAATPSTASTMRRANVPFTRPAALPAVRSSTYEVETVLAQFGYTASFVDMSAANDEGGGGGNVHCATFSTHVPPS